MNDATKMRYLEVFRHLTNAATELDKLAMPTAAANVRRERDIVDRDMNERLLADTPD